MFQYYKRKNIGGMIASCICSKHIRHVIGLTRSAVTILSALDATKISQFSQARDVVDTMVSVWTASSTIKPVKSGEPELTALHSPPTVMPCTYIWGCTSSSLDFSAFTVSPELSARKQYGITLTRSKTARTILPYMPKQSI